MDKHSSQAVLIGVLSGALVVAVGIAALLYLKPNLRASMESKTKDNHVQPAVISNVVASSQSKDIPMPSKIDAFNMLYGVKTKHGKIKTGKNKISNIWFDKTLSHGAEAIYVVFTRTYNLNESGEIESCHACSPEIGAITYKKQLNEWQVVSKQKSFTSFGSWGDSDDDIKPEMFQLSTTTTSFLLESGYGNFGQMTLGKTIFSFSDNTWRDLGSITTSEDNSGACDETLPPTDELYRKCWSYDGKISVIPKQNTKYPDLLVVRTGSSSDNDKVGNITYKFNGSLYVEKN